MIPISFSTDIKRKCLFHFQSILYNVYTKPLFFPQINTLAELDKSDLLISVSSPVFYNLFGNNKTSGVLSSLNQKFRTHENDLITAMGRTAKQGDICCVERYSDIHLYIQVIFVGQILNFLTIFEFCDTFRFMGHILNFVTHCRPNTWIATVARYCMW